MQFHNYISEIASAVRVQDGDKLASLLSLDGPHIPKLLMGMHDSSRPALARYIPSVIAPWGDIAVAHVQVFVYVGDMPEDAFREQDALVNQHFLVRFFKDSTSWVLPALYVLLRDLRHLAQKADAVPFRSSQASKMEDAARTCNKAFSLCMSDRNPAADSRRWGTYYLAGLVMKCYFKIHTISLSRNIIRALKANPEVPPLNEFPKLHQLTYKYYIGLLSFLNEEYEQADADLSFAFNISPPFSPRNLSRILAFLIPLRILRGQLPSAALLAHVPIYKPLVDAVRGGDLSKYDAIMTEAEGKLVSVGVWYVWERVRDVCLRGLFRRVWLASGRGTRIPVSHFHAALVLSSPTASTSWSLSPSPSITEGEAECLVANMIFKGFMRGYISHEKQMVVLSGKSAFPPLRERAAFV
ncbi:PCI-domain-containing protein [Hysterangium stoloniferum]|nr:PCI-domain-containing protein [Hysterangium stoloniferum]